MAQEERVKMASDQDPAVSEPIPMPHREPLQADLVWRCADCGYQRQAPEPLRRCPDCGAGTERIEGRTTIEWRILIRRPAVLGRG